MFCSKVKRWKLSSLLSMLVKFWDGSAQFAEFFFLLWQSLYSIEYRSWTLHLADYCLAKRKLYSHPCSAKKEEADLDSDNSDQIAPSLGVSRGSKEITKPPRYCWNSNNKVQVYVTGVFPVVLVVLDCHTDNAFKLFKCDTSIYLELKTSKRAVARS